MSLAVFGGSDMALLGASRINELTLDWPKSGQSLGGSMVVVVATCNGGGGGRWWW